MASVGIQEALSSSSSSSFSSSSSASSSLAPQFTYDVFLSFYGRDTRKNFTDHLYAALKQKGIIVFRDAEKLERGKYIYQELLKAIEESQYAIIVISKRYAFSKWCLIELTKIMEHRAKERLKVLPIFYHVDPSDVRKQKGSFEKALAMHEEDPKVDGEQTKRWKAALNDVGQFAGWHIDYSHESEVVEEISQKILDELRCNSSNIIEGLVGIGCQVEKVISLLCLGLDDVRFVGIWGMGGIGKTTLAKVIYDRFSSHFEASCFIAHIREEVQNHGMVHLQTQLICRILKESGLRIWNTYEGIDMIAKKVCHKRVFIVFDDVNTEDQLKALAGNHDWFGRGSKIILTSRDLHLLKRYVDDIYEVKELNDDESLELISWKAFKKNHPKKDYVHLCKDIARYAEGLPLALEVFGSYLFGRTMNAWKDVLHKLRTNPKVEILDKLQISFDGLEDSQKKLFLDIACLFDGMYVPEDLECLGHYLAIDLEVLRDKSLIKDINGELQMHDLMRKMDQQIVYRESPSEPGKRSRLWSKEDIIHVLKYNTGTDMVEAIILNIPLQRQEQLSLEAFSKLKRLKMLVISDNCFNNGFYNLEWDGDPLSFMLSNELCYLEWPRYPLQFLPTNWQANNLVALKIPYNCIKKWDEMMVFEKLTDIDMSYSCNLIEIPDFSGVPNLELLDLKHCENLFKIHSSLGFLKRLLGLDMEGCISLDRLPDEINLESLKYLNLVGCSKLENFPEIIGHMTSLDFLDLTRTNISRLPLSFKSLSSLRSLNLCGCLRYRTFNYLPGMFISGFFVKSEERKFFMEYSSHYDKEEGSNNSNPTTCLLPSDFSSFSSLRELDLSYRNFLNVDISFDFSCLSSLMYLNLSGNKLTTIPNSVYKLPNLQILYLRNCSSLQTLPKRLFYGLSTLEVLDLGYCMLDGLIPNNFGCLSSLRGLSLAGNKFKRIPDLIQLSKLSILNLDDCTELEVLPKLSLSLTQLNLSNCLSLEISCVENLLSCLSLEITREMVKPKTNECFLSVHIDYGGRPYKILHLPSYPRSDFLADWGCARITNVVAPALVSQIPDWFNRRLTSSFSTIESCLQLEPHSPSGGVGLILLIIFQVEPDTFRGQRKKQKVDQHGNSNYKTVGANNPAFPQFLCHFQFNEVGMKESLSLSAPQVPSVVGPNAFWVFISHHWLFRRVEAWRRHKLRGLIKGRFEASIESCDPNVLVECGARAVYFYDRSELTKIISDISPHALDIQNCEKLLHKRLEVRGLEKDESRSFWID